MAHKLLHIAMFFIAKEYLDTEGFACLHIFSFNSTTTGIGFSTNTFLLILVQRGL